jgi:serine/threonine protein kinase
VETKEGDWDERFKVIRLLGQGSCGSVYHVKDLNNGNKDLALKVLGGEGSFENFTRDRFVKELLILCTIRHKNIVSAYEPVKFQGKDGYTMELIQGSDLGALLQDSRKFSFAEIDSIMKQLLMGVQELHRFNIIHRDIKLENILLREDGVVKLNDLGLVKILKDTPKTDPGLILGTAHYLSPEYILNKEIDHRTDIYACGIILWELLSGRRRFVETNSEKVLGELIELNFQHPMPDLALTNSKYLYILKKSLAVNVDDRFESADDMRNAFIGILPTSRMIRYFRKNKPVAYLVRTLILTLAVVAIYFSFFY